MACELNKNHLFPFIAITETWLKSYIREAQINIPNYVVSRCDRGSRVGGGVLLYSHEKIPRSSHVKHDDGICQVVFCRFDSVKTSVAVVYRPTDAPFSSFSAAMEFVEKQIQDIDDDSYQHCVMGDFNFPNLDWKSGIVKPGDTIEENLSAERLLNFMSNQLMNQFIHTPTRGSNILDILLTNNDSLVTNITCSDTKLSDHRMADIMLSTNLVDDKHFKESKENKLNSDTFRGLDFRKGNFDAIRQELKNVDWEYLRLSSSFEEFPKIFTEKLLAICKANVPVKKMRTGRPQALNKLRRKKKRIQARYEAVSKHGNPEHAKNLKKQLALLCYDIKEAITNGLEQKEVRAITKIKSNPKYFFSYAKMASHVKSSISMLFNKNDEVVTDKKEMANILQDHFTSVFSDPNSPHIQPPTFSPPNITTPFADQDFELTDEDIISAICEIQLDSACGPDGIPAILLLNCKSELCKPIRIIWSESFSTGIVPAFYK